MYLYINKYIYIYKIETPKYWRGECQNQVFVLLVFLE